MSKPTQYNAQIPAPSRIERNKLKRDFKAKKQTIDKAMQEGRYFEQIIPAQAEHIAIKFLSENSNIDLIACFPHKTDKSQKVLVMQSNLPIDHNSLEIGSFMKSLSVKVISELVEKQVQKEQAKQAQPFEMTFEKDIAQTMYVQLKDQFKILAKTYDMQKGKMVLTFDFSDCPTRFDWQMRIAQILDAASNIRYNNYRLSDEAILMQMARDLMPAVMSKTMNVYAWVTGELLIKSGMANCIDSTSPFVRTFQKIMNWIRGRKKFDYWFMGRIVDAEKYYVAKVEAPCEKSDLNHAEELRLRYEYGEQHSRGTGIKLAQKYYNEIVALHNNSIDAENQ